MSIWLHLFIKQTFIECSLRAGFRSRPRTFELSERMLWELGCHTLTCWMSQGRPEGHKPQALWFPWERKQSSPVTWDNGNHRRPKRIKPQRGSPRHSTGEMGAGGLSLGLRFSAYPCSAPHL